MPKQPQIVNISIATIAKVFLIGLLCFFIWQFVSNFTFMILVFIMALFAAIAINPLVVILNNLFKFKNRRLAVGLAFVLLFICLGGLFIITVPVIISHISEFAGNLPETVNNFKSQDNFMSNFIVKYRLDEQISTFANTIAQRVTGDLGNIVDIFKSTFSALVFIVLMLMMTFILLVEGPNLIKQLKKVVSQSTIERWQKLGPQMHKVITGYINGQLLIALIAGVSAGIVMAILKIPNAVGLAAIVSIFALIPLVGATLGALIVIILSLLVNINSALILAIYFIIYQQIENVTIQPWIQGQKTNLTTLEVIITALIGATLAGVIGAILAIPIVACLKILIGNYLIRRNDLELA